MSVVLGKSVVACTVLHALGHPARSRRKTALVSRSNRLTVRAASTPAVATEAVTEPLTKSALVKYMASGCRPREAWRFGTEHEKLGYRLSDHRRPSYDEIRQMLETLCGRFGWKPIMEEGKIIGATFEGQSVTLEPGGQLELSGAPVDTLHKTCAEVNSHLYQVKTIAEEMGMAFLGLGFDPKWQVPEVPIMPKDRYRIMRQYMPKVGSMGHDMMFRSCTVQVNLDFESEADMVEKMRVSLALQPVCTALFANSPFRDGRPTGYKSWRSHVWTDVDNNRCGILPFVFDPGFGFERYVEYALDVPMYFVYRGGRYVDVTGQSFRDFIRGELPSLPGELATMNDWENHLTTIFPEVRLKKFMEMRGADSAPWRMICALSALWVGLLYDREAQAVAADLISDWTAQERVEMREQVPRLALQTPFRDGTVNDLAKKMLALSHEGLQRRGMGEETFLSPLMDIAESGQTLADVLLEKYYGEWNEDVDKVYAPEFSY